MQTRVTSKIMSYTKHLGRKVGVSIFKTTWNGIQLLRGTDNSSKEGSDTTKSIHIRGSSFQLKLNAEMVHMFTEIIVLAF